MIGSRGWWPRLIGLYHCGGGRSSDLRVWAISRILSSRDTRLSCNPQPPQHKLQAPPSTRPPWSACRPPVAVAEWWRGWAGGSLFPPGCAADSSLPHFLTSQRLLPPSGPCSSYLRATPGRPNKQSCAVPYSAFPSERAARLALLAHRPRGFSPPSLSLFLPLPPPSVRPSLTQPSTTICLSTTINTQPQPQSSPTFFPASAFLPFRCQHHFVPWCWNNPQPGPKPCNSP